MSKKFIKNENVLGTSRPIVGNIGVFDADSNIIDSGISYVSLDSNLWGYQDFAAGVITGTSITLTANQNGTSAPFDPSKFYFTAQTPGSLIVCSDDPSEYVYTSGIGGLFGRLVSVSAQSGISITLNRIPDPTTPIRIYFAYRGIMPDAYQIPPSNILNSNSALKLDELFVTQDEIVDNLLSTDPTKVASANSTRVLKDLIDGLTPADIGGFDEAVDDEVAALIQPSTSIMWDYDDVGATLTGELIASAADKIQFSTGVNEWDETAFTALARTLAANSTVADFRDDVGLGASDSVAFASLNLSATTGNSLVVDTSTFVVDATNNRVGINTASPSYALQIGTAAINATTMFVNGYISGGGTSGFATVQNRVRINLASSAAGGYASVVDFVYTRGGAFRACEDNVVGSNDIFFQGVPIATSGYTILEAWSSAGLIIGTGNNNNPVQIRINRSEILRFQNSGAIAKFIAGTTLLAPIQFTNSANLLTTPLSGVSEFNTSFYQTKHSTLRYGLGGVIADFIDNVNNVGTSETDLYSYTTPANTLATTREKIIASYSGIFNDTGATAQIKAYFAGTVILDTGAITVGATGAWTIDIMIIRTGASTARAMARLITPTATIPVYSAETDLTGLTFSNTNILKITGTAGGGTGGDSDITAKLGYIEWKAPAAN